MPDLAKMIRLVVLEATRLRFSLLGRRSPPVSTDVFRNYQD
jgi:hypothetical protein